jgi:hypothetical protein
MRCMRLKRKNASHYKNDLQSVAINPNKPIPIRLKQKTSRTRIALDARSDSNFSSASITPPAQYVITYSYLNIGCTYINKDRDTSTHARKFAPLLSRSNESSQISKMENSTIELDLTPIRFSFLFLRVLVLVRVVESVLNFLHH